MPKKTQPKTQPKTLYKLALFALFLLTAVLAFHGWRQSGRESIDSFYGVIQLAFLDGDTIDTTNWRLQFARFILPLFTVGAIFVSLFFQTVKKGMLALKMRLFPADIIFIGDRRSIRIFADNFQGGKGRKRVFISLKEQGGEESLFGDIITRRERIDRDCFTTFHMGACRQLYLSSEKDEVNIRIGEFLVDLLLQGERETLPDLILRVDDPVIEKVLWHNPLFLRYKKRGGVIYWVNPESMAARKLLRQYPLLTTSSSAVSSPLHVGIIGFSRFSEELILQILRSAAYLHPVALHLTLFSPNQEAFHRFEESLHEVLSSPSLLEEIGEPAVQLERRDIRRCGPIRHEVSAAEQQHGPFAVLYICEPSDYLCLERGFRLRQAYYGSSSEPRCVVCFPASHFTSVDQFRRLIDMEEEKYAGLHLFNLYTEIIVFEEQIFQDLLGIHIHAAYSFFGKYGEEQVPQPGADESSLDDFATVLAEATTEWKTSLPEKFKVSSRQAGEHLLIKLRDLGFLLLPSADGAGDDYDTILSEIAGQIQRRTTPLQQMEHRRFCRERLVDGWLPAETKYRPLDLNDTLIAYDDLPRKEQAKDRAIISVIPFLLASGEIRRYYTLKRLEEEEGKSDAA